MVERLTPEEIERAAFPEHFNGYDPARVDALLSAAADEIRLLQAELEHERTKAAKPYLAAGREIGSLLERAEKVSDEIVKEAGLEAARLRQDAEKDAAAARTGLDRAHRDAQRQARDLMEHARSEAERMKKQADHSLRLAEAELSLARRDGRAEAKQITAKARAEAEKIRAEAADSVEKAERRVRKLQQVEAELTEKMRSLGDIRLDDETISARAGRSP
jgi:DivIVA domain-containing protein